MHILGDDPTFCFIAPVEYLDLTTVSTSHLVLAHMIEEDPDYTEFYRNHSRAGDLIIMDNSAFEFGESFDPTKLLALGKMVEADVIVLPDYPGKDVQVTIDAAEHWAPIFNEAGFKCMFVPQSERGRLDQWMKGYEYAANNPRIEMIGMSILGIPNALPHLSNTYARVVMTELLQFNGIFSTKHHHYLGLNTGPALEIPSLLRMGALDTIDSSGPIWAGITGHRYCENTDSYMSVSKVQMPVNFHQPYIDKPTVENNIAWNMQLTMNLFK